MEHHVTYAKLEFLVTGGTVNIHSIHYILQLIYVIGKLCNITLNVRFTVMHLPNIHIMA